MNELTVKKILSANDTGETGGRAQRVLPHAHDEIYQGVWT